MYNRDSLLMALLCKKIKMGLREIQCPDFNKQDWISHSYQIKSITYHQLTKLIVEVMNFKTCGNMGLEKDSTVAKGVPFT